MKQHEKKAKWKIRCDLLKCSYFFDFCSIGVKLQWETLSCLCGGIPQISPILLVLECCSCTSKWLHHSRLSMSIYRSTVLYVFPLFHPLLRMSQAFWNTKLQKIERRRENACVFWLWLAATLPQKISFVIEHEKLKEKKLPFYYCRVCAATEHQLRQHCYS